MFPSPFTNLVVWLQCPLIMEFQNYSWSPVGTWTLEAPHSHGQNPEEVTFLFLFHFL